MTTIGNYLARLPVSWLNVRETLQAFEAWKAAHPGAELDNIHTKSVARWDANGKEVGAVNVAFYPHTMRVRLFYTIFDRRTGEREETEKWFCIASRPSNLGEGRGRRYYFVCPVTGRLAQKLYIVEGKAVTLHELRERGGVSYWYQNKSHWERGCRWHDLKTGDVLKPYGKFTYRGKPTRYYKRVERAERRIKKREAHFLQGMLRICGAEYRREWLAELDQEIKELRR